MSEAFVISDTHFGHRSILQHAPSRGRLWKTIADMDKGLIERWNETVGARDTVYHLGDVAFGSQGRTLGFLQKLRGRKVLLPGNHDLQHMGTYVELFDRVLPGVWFWSSRIVFSHAPMHPSCLGWSRGRKIMNVHGHIHERVIEKGIRADPRYFNACVEQIDFRPFPVDELVKRVRKVDAKAFLEEEW